MSNDQFSYTCKRLGALILIKQDLESLVSPLLPYDNNQELTKKFYDLFESIDELILKEAKYLGCLR